NLASGDLGSRTLSHATWMLSGVCQYAIASGVVSKNPCTRCEVACESAPSRKTAGLFTRGNSIHAGHPLAARPSRGCSLFAALRPAEIRGLQWTDYNGTDELSIKRLVWQNSPGESRIAFRLGQLSRGM